MPTHRWGEPEWHASTASTQTLVLADPRPGRVVVAEHQSAGQGRRGRTWTAPPGTSLAVSVALLAPGPDRRGWLPLVAGLAVQRALRASRYAVSAVLKWPNDVLVPEDGRWRKIAGTLTQVAPGRPGRPDTVVLGTGLNIDQTRSQLPGEGATSWRLARRGAVLPDGAGEAWLTDYLDTLTGLLDTLAADPRAVVSAYRAACSTIGRTVRVDRPGGAQVTGEAVGVDDTGALLVAGPEGVGRHLAGDVVHVRSAEGTGTGERG